MISRLFRTAILAAIGAAVFAAVRKLTQPGDPLPAPASPTGGPWPPLRPEPDTDSTSTAPPATGRVTTPQSARPAPAEAPGEASGPPPIDPTKADPTKADTAPKPTKTGPGKTGPAKTRPLKADPTPAPAPKPTDATGAPAVVPEPDGTPVADSPTPGAAPSTTTPANQPWAEADDDGNCPEGYPIKANLKSKIFHSPGQLNYDRTNPDRCYVDAAAAESDGLRPAKR